MKKIIFLALCFLSTTTFAYIPDLFGAGMRGAEQARQDNARDAYYYQQLNRPTFMMGVYAQGESQPKGNARASISKQDAICWILYNIPENTEYQTTERFIQPVDSLFGGATSNIVGQKRLTGNVIEFYRKVNSGDSNQVEGCWTLTEKIPTGRYSLTVTIGNHEFNTQNFIIVD